MANCIKSRFIICRVKHRESDFNNLVSAVYAAMQEDYDKFYSLIQNDPDFCSIDFDQDPYIDEEKGEIQLSLYFKTFDFTETDIGKFVEYFNDNIIVGVECSYCDEYEETTSAGLYKKNLSKWSLMKEMKNMNSPHQNFFTSQKMKNNDTKYF